MSVASVETDTKINIHKHTLWLAANCNAKVVLKPNLSGRDAIGRDEGPNNVQGSQHSTVSTQQL